METQTVTIEWKGPGGSRVVAGAGRFRKGEPRDVPVPPATLAQLANVHGLEVRPAAPKKTRAEKLAEALAKREAKPKTNGKASKRTSAKSEKGESKP
jgi:hypothetical protein